MHGTALLELKLLPMPDGTFHLYFKARPGPKGHTRMGLAIADRVEGPYVIQPQPVTGNDRVIEDGSFKRYYPHQTSHWLGLDVHDVGRYYVDGSPRALEPGMVFTVEPGLYVPATDDSAPEALRGVGIRIEDDVVVTEASYDNLSEGIPKELGEIEALKG